MKLNLKYVSDVPYGGAIIPSGTVIGQIELPDACNPQKLPTHVAAGLLRFEPDVPAEAEDPPEPPPPPAGGTADAGAEATGDLTKKGKAK